MKQILIISGKGGTGKTVVTAAFASLAENKILVDCDVDAANLHLILNPESQEVHEFRSGKTAFISKDQCCSCGLCQSLCRFEAIKKDTLSDKFLIDSVSCEGCGFCALACPSGAIEMKENLSGQWFVSNTRFGLFVHAKLGIAEENSGKLVATVKQKAKELAKKNNVDWIIVDGSPGIGCPVIASLSDVDCAIIVSEPTVSGIHDAKRVMEVADHFKVPVKMIINKFDLNEDMTKKIEMFSLESNIEVIGKIPFDKRIVESVSQGKTVIENGNQDLIKCFSEIWERVKKGFFAL
ncbi:MAG: ATP-binding protein [Candidatus Omnitrophica bacterium]|nr:ATP-binding protein [Candidatus Omnitrophota bacterium]